MLLIALFRINWGSFLKLYSKNAKVVVVLSVNRISDLFRINYLWDLGYIRALIKSEIKFSIVKNNLAFKNKIVLWSPYKRMLQHKFVDYAKTLIHFVEQLENQQNMVFPSSYETSYLENKDYMYRKFEELKINHPQTFLLKKPKDIEKIDIQFPCLIKGEHSAGSEDVFKIDNRDHFYKFLEENKFLSRNKTIIVQELLNIRQDLRVTLVGDEVVLAFWRINKGEEWKPTATKYGSVVDFNNFPEQWRSSFIKEFKKLGVYMGAFDVTWQNDDLSTKPYYLEFSPRFSPNPPVDLSNMPFEYGDYKKVMLPKNSYESNYTNIVYEISEKYINHLIEKNKL